MSLEHAPDRQRANAGNSGLRLKEFCRYADLEAAGLFASRMTLDRAIARGDFPSGRLMGNIRIWTRAEIEEALARCPTGKLPARPPKRETVPTWETVQQNGPVTRAARTGPIFSPRQERVSMQTNHNVEPSRPQQGSQASDTALDRRPAVLVVTSEAATALKIAKNFDAIADDLEVEQRR